MRRAWPLFLPLLFACPGEPDPDPTFTPWTLEELPANKGFSLRIDEFEVAAGKEKQDCYFLKVPDLANGADLWVHRIHAAQNPGTHHFNVFRVKTILALNPDLGEPITIGGIAATVVRGDELTSECWKAGNWADWPLVANTQNSDPTDPYTDWTLPDGVATKLVPGETLMLQTHYVNATTQASPYKGRVGVNFHLFEGPGQPIELGTLFATQQSIRVCQSNPTPTYSGTCRFPAGDVTIAAANGHFHSRGSKFEVFTWDGTTAAEPAASAKFYESSSWDDPPMSTGLSIAAPSQGGVWWNCHYQWNEPAAGCDAVNARDKEMGNDCCYTFGPIVESSEHCNVFLYYYPKVERTDIFCN